MRMKSNHFKINRKFYFSFLLSIFCLFLLMSCSQDDPADTPVEKPAESVQMKTLGNLTLQKNVIILNDESVNAISAHNEGQITFSRMTPQTDSISAGTVIVGTKVEGDQVSTILSKVSSVSKANNQFTVQTSSAKLEEFIYSGTLSGMYDPSDKAPVSINGKMVNYVPVEGMVSQEINNKIFSIEARNLQKQKIVAFNRFNFDKTFSFPLSSAGTSSVNVKGGFSPKIDYNITFSWGHLSDFYVNFIMDDIQLQSTATIVGSLGYTASTTDYLNIPIVPIVLGPTGLILSPTISAGPFLGVQATGKVQGQLLDLEGNANFLVSKTPAININLQKKSDPAITSVEGNLSAEAGLEAKGAVGLMFISIPIANSGLRGRASALSSLGLTFIPERKGVFSVKGKIQADMFYGFGISPLRYEGTFPLFKKEYMLYQKDFNF
ncbi:Lipoprotein [Chryseobacterium sp. IT-36CA2]